MLAYYADDHEYSYTFFAQKCAEEFEERLTVYTSSDYVFGAEVSVVKLPIFSANASKMEPSSPEMQETDERRLMLRSEFCVQSMIENNTRFAIIDANPRIAASCKEAAIPYLFVKRPGKRNDSAHLTAFKEALFIISYYPEECEHQETPEWVRKKTVYLGYFTNSFKRPPVGKKLTSAKVKTICILAGNGEKPEVEEKIKTILDRFSRAETHIFGSPNKRINRVDLIYHEQMDDLQEYLNKADLVISDCNLANVAQIVESGTTFCAIPEDHPYGEQVSTFRGLKANKIAFGIAELAFRTDFEIIAFQSEAYKLEKPLRGFRRLKKLLGKYGHPPSTERSPSIHHSQSIKYGKI